MNNALSHRFAVRVADWLNTYVYKEGLAYKKVVLGCELLFMNITKLAVILFISALLGIIPQTLLALVGFNVIRRTAFGAHGLSDFSCSTVSKVIFVFFPYIMRDMVLPLYVIAPALMFVVVSVYLFAPADTEARPIIGADKRKKMRIHSVAAALLLTTVVLVLPYNVVKNMVTWGAFCEAIFILPLTYYALGRRRNNYARYEQVGTGASGG